MLDRSKVLVSMLVVIGSMSFKSVLADTQESRASCQNDAAHTNTESEVLSRIYAAHQEWLDAYNLRSGPWTDRQASEVSTILTDPRRANLCNNFFVNANLYNQVWIGANLRRGDFRSAKLVDTDFTKAQLNDSSFIDAILLRTLFVDASLSKSRFGGARAVEAVFDEATLQRVSFEGATLTRASFNEATLNRADLRKSDLRSASLIGADLSFALFEGANVRGVIFEPKANHLPSAASIARSQNLDQLTYANSAAGLIELREKFRESGLVQEARKITYAIRKTQRQQKWQGDLRDRIDSIFQLMFFEWPVDYGLAIGRPLIILVAGILFFSVPYFASLRWPGSDGIWRVWPKERVRRDLGSSAPELVQLYGARAASYAIYFSLLTAFHLGWRDLNVGTWLSRIQPKEYALVATGWVRTVAGVQSILSVYLVALWVLSYFGQPFG